MLPQAFHKLAGAVHAGVGQDDAELIAAQTPGDVGATDAAAHKFSERGQDLVAGRMPVSVVDGLEAVDIAEAHR